MVAHGILRYLAAHFALPTAPVSDVWQGQMNEHICASALYYYDEQNITPSYLAFREFVNRDILMEKAGQHREWGYCQIYGINDNWGDAQQVSTRTSSAQLMIVTDDTHPGARQDTNQRRQIASIPQCPPA